MNRHPDYETAYQVALQMRNHLDRMCQADPTNRTLPLARAGAQMVVDALALEGGRLDEAAPVGDTLSP